MSDTLYESLLRELFRDRASAVAFVQVHPWLLIPDVSPELLKTGQQGCYCDIEFAQNCRADFATYEIRFGRLHWQLTCFASPGDSILTDSQPSTEWLESNRRIESWREQLVDGNSLLEPATVKRAAEFSFRLVIGQSRNQTPDEQAEVRQQRQGNLRIRSFCWLLEKPSHYSKAEITALESWGPARTSLQMEQELPDLWSRIAD